MYQDDDHENEGIGIIAIIVLALLAVIGLYFLFSYHPAKPSNRMPKTSIPLEVPSPLP